MWQRLGLGHRYFLNGDPLTPEEAQRIVSTLIYFSVLPGTYHLVGGSGWGGNPLAKCLVKICQNAVRNESVSHVSYKFVLHFSYGGRGGAKYIYFF